MDIPLVLSGVAVGSGFGFVLQRGRFCLNTAFRNAFHIRDFTLLRAYCLALVIALVSANLLDLAGILHLNQIVQDFTWLANILGGYLFGIGMVLAGADAAATWYRAGEGLVGPWMAGFGLMIGAAATSQGVLSGVAAEIESFVLTAANGDPMTIHGLFGLNKWIVIALLAGALLAFVFSGRRNNSSVQEGYQWRTTAILVGLIIVLGLYIEELMSDSAQGISIAGPSGDLLVSIVQKRRWDWGMAMLAGIPLGSFISATGLREFSWRAPRADVIALQFAGGLIMGVGGVLAAGCTVGHGLTGIAVMALSSLVSMLFIVLGSFTMVYVLFMRRS